MSAAALHEQATFQFGHCQVRSRTVEGDGVAQTDPEPLRVRYVAEEHAYLQREPAKHRVMRNRWRRL